MNNSSKTLAMILGAAVLAGGGTYALTPSDATAIQAELDTQTAYAEQLKVEKIATGRDFIYSQITSGRVPAFTGALTSEEMAQAYIEAYYANEGKEKTDALMELISSGKEVNLLDEIKASAEAKGQMLQCR